MSRIPISGRWNKVRIHSSSCLTSDFSSSNFASIPFFIDATAAHRGYGNNKPWIKGEHVGWPYARSTTILSRFTIVLSFGENQQRPSLLSRTCHAISLCLTIIDRYFRIHVTSRTGRNKRKLDNLRSLAEFGKVGLARKNLTMTRYRDSIVLSLLVISLAKVICLWDRTLRVWYNIYYSLFIKTCFSCFLKLDIMFSTRVFFIFESNLLSINYHSRSNDDQIFLNNCSSLAKNYRQIERSFPISFPFLSFLFVNDVDVIPGKRCTRSVKNFH